MKVIVAEMKDVEGFWRILCPKDGWPSNSPERVPIYHCAGSYVRGRRACEYMRSVSIGKEEAKVECLYPEKTREDL